MVSAVKSPKPWDLMVEAVVPVLGQVVGNADDEESPPKRNPGEHVSRMRQQERQEPQSEVGDGWPHHKQREGKANDVGQLFIAIPSLTVIEAEQKFHYPRQNMNSDTP